MAARSTELQNGLNGAIAKQLWTKKFGVATAKKIEAGQYEIGMSKAVCKAIPAFIDVLSKTANTELWEVIPLKGKNAYLHFIGNKLVRISY